MSTTPTTALEVTIAIPPLHLHIKEEATIAALRFKAYGITSSPLCRACMEADETPTHVLLQCRGVEEQRAAYLGSPASLPEALGDLGGLLSFWSELGWLEPYQWHYEQRKVPADQVRRQAQRKKDRKRT
ncbi:jg18974 [Pararge aegeria aegeria]|uniref:Jg18974 protein n=1 Tax=Pararge aegeria aegeria TaxID=348720 RepID=A0A8S4QY38_9NEOP|nr:jg18974 [Pararge aegeria aegeria]